MPVPKVHRLRESNVITKTVKVFKALSPQPLNRPLFGVRYRSAIVGQKSTQKNSYKGETNLSYLESQVLGQASPSKG